MSDKELHENELNDAEGETVEDEIINEFHFTNPDPYFKIHPVPPERRVSNYWTDEDGNIRVKNTSANWIPDANIEMEIGGTNYTVTGTYDGKETLDKKWRRILAKWVGDKDGK